MTHFFLPQVSTDEGFAYEHGRPREVSRLSTSTMRVMPETGIRLPM